jgi:hypothetical protein
MEQRILERVSREFQGSDRETVVQLLESYVGPESDRVRWDILELSEGSVGRSGTTSRRRKLIIVTFSTGLNIIKTTRCYVVATRSSWLMRFLPNGAGRMSDDGRRILKSAKADR